VTGYFALAMRRYEVREIVAQFSGRPWSLNVRAFVEVSLLDVITAFLIWAATFFALASISSGVKQTKTGRPPSVQEAIRALLKHSGASVRLSLLLFLVWGLLLTIAGAAVGGVFWAFHRTHLQTSYFGIMLVFSSHVLCRSACLFAADSCSARCRSGWGQARPSNLLKRGAQ
jgi:hypothetical protein